MARYYVNDRAQANGDHEVHKENCKYMPNDKTYLGDFSTCKPAVEAAKKKYPTTANGCFYCANDCHTR
jgi:hypothetical protein